MAWFPADVAVPRESATLILLRPTRATLTLETRSSLAVLLWLLPASALGLALAWLVPSFGLGAAWPAGAAVATARLPSVSTRKHQVIMLSN